MSCTNIRKIRNKRAIGMALYEYKCPKCKNTIELQQKIDNRISPICCNEGCDVEMDLLISKSSFSLKGGGWFKDGY